MNRALRPIAAIIPVALGGYLFQAHRQVSHVKPSEVSVGEVGSASILESTAHAIVNPSGHARSPDVRSIVIELPPSKRSRSDEEILAEYVDGFFGGWVFAPEQMAGVEGESIWTRQELKTSRVPTLGSILFGAFQVIDASIIKQLPDEYVDTKDDRAESYIDFGFGSDRSSFSGFHRLSVRRLEPFEEEISDIEKPSSSAENSPTLIRLTLSCFACNPSLDRPMGSGLLRTFHLTYAMLLFREGVANVLHG
ncbi:hypothetical protein H2200_000850 [Cladophialophora chaetospira]|uniref:Uncharacterized protein n=1 Tax=Cladophialophora chaetospira TaxID=386627 RepID=A0AA38XQA4_9EURO|nr:hypothetical protein H2200_000850 [Cladophialophora chaetospira]